MGKKKSKIKYKKERVVMSDILPYEIPITFSNRHFYKFLVKNNIELKNNKLFWKKDDEAFNVLIEFLFNFKIDRTKIVENNGINSYEFIKLKNYKPYQYRFLSTIPFNYKISHKQKEFRELSVIHPANQLSVIEFYEKYKELIIYFCNSSKYSIRKPTKVAKFTFFNDVKHKEKKVDEPERELIEVFGKEYENLKTFFAYKEFSNIYKFYESYIYQRSEKKFNSLYKFDISKCFDSIYTHSLSWSLSNKEIVKDNISTNNFTFGGTFDVLQQKMNYNETNGIIIGPEFSRIFAEILLQQIDKKVEKKLRSENLRNKLDYSIFRYVDDYFLFYNSDDTRDNIVEVFKHELKKYNLFVNSSKNEIIQKPIITQLTIAKERISNLLNQIIKIDIQDIEQNDDFKKYSINFNSKRAIIDFKTIIKETDIEYKNILNYTLSVIDRKLFKIIKIYEKAKFETQEKEQTFKKSFIKFTIELIDFIMFLYSVSPRINTTIKLCTILTKVTKFTKEKTEKDTNKKYFNYEQKDIIFKKIFDDVSLVLNKNKNNEHTQVETLYLLILLKELGRDYRLDFEALIDFLNIEKYNNGDYKFPYEFNYFSISVLMFYIRNIKRYERLKESIYKHIEKRISNSDTSHTSKNTEIVLLTLDMISSPFVDQTFKTKILNLNGINTNEIQIINKIEKQENMFTKWRNFDFEKELNSKRSQEVY